MNDWSAAVSGARRDAALRAAEHVGKVIGDRTRVQHAVACASMQTAFPRSVHWLHHDLAQGDAGLALVCAQFDRCWPDHGWDIVGHEYLSCAVGSVQGGRIPAGLFNGLAGLAFVTRQLSRAGVRYARLARTLDRELDVASAALARSVDARSAGFAASEFDAICGLAGIAAYLLARPGGAGLTGAGATRDRVLGALVRLLRARGRDVPRWMTPPEYLVHADEVRRYPRGNLNCGLAHGMPGPLATLSMALAAGVQVDGLRDAVQEAVRWLVSHRVDDRWGVNWPVAVTLPDDGTGPDEPSRAAWCYGSPGLARALWLAGVALQDDGIRALAIEAMAGVYARPIAARRIDSPTFCHGVAGLLQITLRFRHDTGDPMFDAAAAALVDQLVDGFEPDDSLLGFRSLESGGNRVDQPGLLDGAPGVALVLLAAATPIEPTWDRLFLLA